MCCRRKMSLTWTKEVWRLWKLACIDFLQIIFHITEVIYFCYRKPIPLISPQRYWILILPPRRNHCNIFGICLIENLENTGTSSPKTWNMPQSYHFNFTYNVFVIYRVNPSWSQYIIFRKLVYSGCSDKTSFALNKLENVCPKSGWQN